MNKYGSHILDNDLHKIWSLYANPKNGIRLSAWMPNRESIYMKERSCRHAGCELTQSLDSDRSVGSYVCPDGHRDAVLYRWRTADPKSGKLWFYNSNQVRFIASRVHTMYHTAAVFDKGIVMLSREHGYPYSHVKSYTIYFDIDVVSKTKTILDDGTREGLQIALDHIRGMLDSCCPNSFSVMSSGNGVYVTIHDSFCEGDDVCDILAKVHLLMEMINIDLSKVTRKVKLDYGINNVARVFKSMGSMHQTYNYLVAIPFEPDVDLMQINTDILLTKNFTVDRIVTNGKVNWNNRVKSSEKSDFLRFLDDTCEELNMEVDRGAVTDAYNAVYKGKRIRYNVSNYAAAWTHTGSRVYTGELKNPIMNSDVPDNVYNILAGE